MRDELKKLLEAYLVDEEALAFAAAFLVYCNFVDDIIDKPLDPEHVIRTFEFGAMLYSSQFYRDNYQTLLPLIKATGNAYADSVKFERSDEAWKRAYADVLRQVGNEVLCACVEITQGYEARREFSQRVRALSYASHHTEKGEPV